MERHAVPERLHTYSRDESTAQQLDRNWAEMVQELRVLGTGVQVLFAFILGIAFQARFSQTSSFQRDVYLATLLLSGFSAAIFIGPVALHRFLFRFGVKDEIVEITNAFILIGLGALTLAIVSAVLLVSDWVAGATAAVLCTTVTALLITTSWFGLPLWLRKRDERIASGSRR
jgi:Family of unknown function (DUF6328)